MLCIGQACAQETTAIASQKAQFRLEWGPPALSKYVLDHGETASGQLDSWVVSGQPASHYVDATYSIGLSSRQLALHALHQELSTRSGASRWERRLAIAQGSYYVVTGIWPILHMRSFEKVTGPKTDDWLVKTVGAMITVVGGSLLISGLRDGPSDDMKLVAAGSAAALAAVDVTYVVKGRISRIYLLDAAAEVALLIGWGLATRQ